MFTARNELITYTGTVQVYQNHTCETKLTQQQ